MAGAAARREEHGGIRTWTNKEDLRFWKTGTSVTWKLGCEDSDGHRRWCRTRRTTAQVLTAMFWEIACRTELHIGP